MKQQAAPAHTRYTEIDSIRGIAALIIMVHHYSKYIYSATGEKNLYLDVIEYGKYTVEFFFVISGLLIFMTLENARRTRDFVFNRFTRLYPAYWACAILTTLVLNFSPYNVDVKISGTELLANLTMLQHWMFIRDIDGIYWTLAVEMCFYIFIYIVFVTGQNKNIEQVGITWLGIMLVAYALSREGYLASYNLFYLVPLLKNGTLFFGGILILQLKKNPQQRKNYFLLFLTLCIHFIVTNLDTTLAILGVYLIFMLFIFDKLKFLQNKYTVYFGLICYPMYLLHQFIGYEIINYMEASGITSVPVKIIVPAIIIICAASIITFSIERPAMFYLRKWYAKK